MDRDLAFAGRHLIRRGLGWILVIAIFSQFRPADEPWQAFAILYAFAWLAVWGGFKLMKRAGAWPPR
jgi:hypothetical protein